MVRSPGILEVQFFNSFSDMEVVQILDPKKHGPKGSKTKIHDVFEITLEVETDRLPGVALCTKCLNSRPCGRKFLRYN